MDFYLNETYLIERTSDRVFHFTSVEAMLKILGTNTIYFQSSLASTSDNKDRKRLFYFSLSRNKDTNFGFNSGAMSNPTECFVRIEFDGDALNRRYRIKPIDYWQQKSYAARNDDYGNSLYGKGWNKGRSRHSFFEYEDRIMTNDSEMYPAMKYIRRIDVYIAPNNVPDNISDLATSKTFFYDNINEFNRQSDKVIENIYDYITSNESTFTPKQTRYGRSDKEIVSGARRFGQLLYGALNMPIPEIAKLFSKYRLEKYLNVFEIKRDIVRQGSIDKYTLSDISSGLSSNMHNISRNPNDASQRFNKMVSDTLRNRGIGSWNELSREVFKSEEDDINYTNLDIPIRCLKVGSKYVLEPDKVSVWKYFPYNDRKTLIDNLYTDIINDYGGSGERHSSKDDEHFYKYLQHKLKNDFTVADFVKLIKKFNIVGMYISEPSEIEWVTMSVSDLWFKYDYKIVDFEGDDIKFSDKLRKLLSIAKKQQSTNESKIRNKNIFESDGGATTLYHSTTFDYIDSIVNDDMTLSAKRGGRHGETYGMNWFGTSKKQTNGKPVIIAIDVPNDLFCDSDREGCFRYMNDHHVVANDDEVDLKQFNPRIVKYGAIEEDVVENLIERYGDDTDEIRYMMNKINRRYEDIFGDVVTLWDEGEGTTFDYIMRSVR